MKYNLLISLFLLFILTSQAQKNDYYGAAVVDYAPYRNKSLTPSDNIQINVDEYNDFIKVAKTKGADIIVFPECGLTSLNLPTDPSSILLYTNVIPEPKMKIVPCKSTKWSLVLQKLSCAARDNKIYVVVNLPEKYTNDNEDLIYNTNIVFDRNGAVIARYRKYNLFVEPGFNRTEKPELISFTTDFNVTFATFICFDILFATPAIDVLRQDDKVTDILYPTAWFSELPFLTAVQTQAGFARAYGVNLLGAGYNNPAGESGGSAIISADGQMTVTIPTQTQSTLVLNQVKKISQRNISTVIENTSYDLIAQSSVGRLETKAEDLTRYTTELINNTVSNYKLCHGKFCCMFTITFQKINQPDYYYRMIAYDGNRIFGILEHGVQICGVAACKDTSLKSCGVRGNSAANPVTFTEISIKGDSFINNEHSLYIPSVVDYSLNTFSTYSYKVQSSGAYNIIELKSVKAEEKLLAFGIYGIVQNNASSPTGMFYIIFLTLSSVYIWYKML